ncbi:bitesize isoform X3 [Rhynchophorus ferrugineus]|uniref:bitesize isoform X3 n=1 Tax=Rhynchophorus ferrugineus TaxID=354439 RepID=UPI003FCE1CD0
MQEDPTSSSCEVLAAATREAAYLTDKERETILAVLTKDEQLRRQQQVKILHLKAELQNLRRKGALKVSDEAYQDPDRTCGRCRSDLGRVINRGACCTSCRLKVCKACREYNFRATDWVCTVCYKRMEIQAASGEWMNEFVRRPSRRRDARVYVPAADIIKRTIRRSWTISNPSPRWAALRTSSELRPYNSLPRGQDISNYPSLAGIRSTDTPRKSPTRRTKSEDVYAEEKESPVEPEKIPKRPARVNPLMSISLRESREEKERRKSPRRKTEPVAESSENNNKKERENNDIKIEENYTKQNDMKSEDEADKVPERHVSFDNSKPYPDLTAFRSRSLSQSKSSKDVKKMPFTTRSLPEESIMKDDCEDPGPVELCDIEPISGTVFRKMTVRRRRQENMRKLPAVDADGEDYRLVFVNSDGSSKEEDVDDNDSSSASSFPIDDCDWDYFEPGAARPHPVLGWASPFGSPRVYRRRFADSPLGSPLLQRRPRVSSDEDVSVTSPSDVSFHPRVPETPRCLHQNATGRQTVQTSYPASASCKTCGGSTTPAAHYIPIPVPVPIPFPVPWSGGTSSAGGGDLLVPLYRSLPDLARGAEFWQYLAQMPGFPWSSLEKPMIGETADEKHDEGEDERKDDEGDDRNESRNNVEEDEPTGHLECENRGSSASESSSTDSSADEGDQPRVRRVYNVTGPPSTRESDDALPSSDVTTDNDDNKSSADEKEREEEEGEEEEEETSSGSADTDSNDTGTVADQKPRRFSRVFVVNHKESSASSGSMASSNSDTDSTDNDTDLELDCTVVLTNIKHIDSEKVECEGKSNVEGDGESGASFIGMKYIGEDGENSSTAGINKKPVKEVRRKHRTRRSNSKKKKADETEDCDRELVKDNEISSSNAEQEDCDKPIEFNEPTTEDHNENAEEPAKKQADENVSEDNDSMDRNASSPAPPSVTTLDYAAEATAASTVEDKGPQVQEMDVEAAIIGKFKTESVYSSSPGLSDVSAESLSSSDAEKEPTTQTRETEHQVEVGRVRRAGGRQSVIGERSGARHGVRYTSLVMIRNDEVPQQVNVVSSSTNDVVVRHTNREEEDERPTLTDKPNQIHSESNVTVITSPETLSAFEEGLADDDSWVENLSDDDFPTNSISENSSSGDEVTLTCSAAIDQEDELRGYHRPIDLTLHTIVEESCEESEVEQAPPKPKKERPASATDLEKYFFFGLGDGTIPSLNSNREDAFSETSSIYSEGMESLGGAEENQNENPEELASSRLEKYFLSGFMGFTAERRDSDGSVGSDSEGKPSPEQRRKRLVRARGTGRSHSSSLDNLLANPDLAGSDQQMDVQNNSEAAGSSSDSDAYDEALSFEKSDGQFDTVKRKKGKKQKASLEDVKNLETTQEEQEGRESDEDEERNKTPQPKVLAMPTNLTTNKNQQSRDSGFVGSCDDLLKDQRDINKSPDISLQHEKITDNHSIGKKDDKIFTESLPPATSLTRKDSFNNWSSDEETNLMMCKMRQFFKTMVANSSSSKPTTPTPGARISPRPLPRAGRARCKPPQLVYFENELTRLMKTVPGIRDDQVREIVEYLSSEDTWSDSYDSSDYTSSDLEGASTKSALQQQISDSCQEIINKFDAGADDKEGDAGDGGIVEDGHGLNKETALVYQKLVASFEKMATEDQPQDASGPNSPPLIAKVMHHIGSRLVALMHEVSSGESHASNSPKGRGHHRRLQQKLSNASTTTTDDDSTSDTNLPDNFAEEILTNYNMLPRSRSHDLLMSDTSKNQSIGGASEISEEREASDCERFSWRGSFESALLATDSRNKLSLIGGEGSASASALAIAAKRRSAGDLLFSHKSLSREQLDRVRSCGSIGGGNSEDKLWVAPATRPGRRRSSVPDAASCGSGASADGEDEDDDMENRATLPRSMQNGPQTTNSLPRLPTTSIATMQKAQSHHFLPQNAKSARYRPPGFSRLMPTQPKRAASAPGLQPSHQRRGRRSQQSSIPSDDVSLSEAHSSPMLASRGGSKSATPSPVAPGSRRKIGSMSSHEWPTNDDDIDRLVAMQHNRSSLSSLGLRSDSMASVYSGAGEGRYGSVAVRGQVEFGLQYNYKASALEIQIKQCKDLAPVDIKRSRSDPYVKVYLLPDKSKSGKRKTKVKKHTLNPVFDECLKFHMSLNELELRTLWLTVWHSDMFGRNDFLGEVMMALENKVFDDPTPKWYNLQERTEPFDDMLSFKGDIIVCLKFVPPDMTVHKKGKRSRGSLHVLVKEAKALTAFKTNGTSDPFCKSYLLPDKGRSSKQKTAVVKRTVNPVWNHTFVYDDVTLQELAERCLELTVWDHDRLASNEFLGGVRFSLGTGKHYGKSVEWMDATGKEVSLWKSMLERPNFWVEGCLPLRPTLDGRL